MHAEPVGWGIGDQEMCMMLGFAETPLIFEGAVPTGMPVGGPGDPLMHSGPCRIAAFHFQGAT